jgi:hypothetical protein
MENLELETVVELAKETGQAFKAKDGIIFTAGVVVGVVANVIIPRAIRVVRNGFVKAITKAKNRKLAKLAAKELEQTKGE